MSDEYYTLGSILKEDELLSVRSAQDIAAAIGRSNRFEHIENRRYASAENGTAEVIIVNCLNDKVPSRNPSGIKNRERLALVFHEVADIAPDTRALRKAFPCGLHQNSTSQGEPISICLYEEPWTSTRRHWTAETYLKRIVWWLEQASKNTLHQDVQPLEPFFFSCGLKLVLPPDFDKKITVGPQKLQLTRNENAILAIWSNDIDPERRLEKHDLIVIAVRLTPILHSGIEQFPITLGGLDKIITARGGALIDAIKTQIRTLAPIGGQVKNENQSVLLLINIPLKRYEESPVEKTQNIGFVVTSDFCSLGESLDVLNFNSTNNRFFKFELLDNQAGSQSNKWEQIQIAPVDVTFAVTTEFARIASAIPNRSADFLGVLAGVGSLGGALANIWASEGWGSWTYIDHDRVLPHNVVRHCAEYTDIGHYKVHVVSQKISRKYYPNHLRPCSISDSSINFKNTNVWKALNEAKILVDASTTLEVPREMAIQNEVPRSMSVFFTPNGLDSVLLGEDKKRKIRLDSLEAQYYRALLRNDWGQCHLENHRGDLGIGNGCRDISTVIPTELIQLHSALLARKIRLAHDQDDALICVNQFSDKFGTSVRTIKPRPSLTRKLSTEWSILFDEGISEFLHMFRDKKLPRETGGILLGFIDYKTKRIFVVDVLEAPFDSEEGSSSFVRGTDGVIEIIDKAQQRTAGIVSYLGEWHSHPLGCKVVPSSLDLKLLDYLGEKLADDGQPALIAIVGDKEISFTLDQSFKNITNADKNPHLQPTVNL